MQSSLGVSAGHGFAGGAIDCQEKWGGCRGYTVPGGLGSFKKELGFLGGLANEDGV